MSEPVVPKRRVVRRNTTASSRGSIASAATTTPVTLTPLPQKPRIVRRKKDIMLGSQSQAEIKQDAKTTVVQQLADRIITKIPESETLIESMDTPIEVTVVIRKRIVS